jgi:transposase InsO family protein
MDIHQNARTCPASRMLLVNRIRSGSSVFSVAEGVGISPRTAFKWLARYRAEGEKGLLDRSSRPYRMPRKTSYWWEEEIVRLRRRRMTGAEIARHVSVSPATVARILARHGLSRAKALESKEPVRRYQREHPGELLHFDIKKLGRIRGVGHRITRDRIHRARGVGWEFVHVAIDDASRLAYAEVLKNERTACATAFLRRTITWFSARGVRVQSLLTDNGSCYRAHDFEKTCQRLGLRHIRTRPYRPCTNGKAERFIQTLLREWAYRRPYHSSASGKNDSLDISTTTITGDPMAASRTNHPPLASVNNLLRLDT